MRPVGDHFYTLSASERDYAVANYGYVSEGTACWVPDAASPVRAPFYRLYSPTNGDHFYTTSAGERNNAIALYGYVAEGITCEVYTVPQPGTVPLHRLYNGSNGDHFYTASAAERDNAVAQHGYVSEGVACAVLPITLAPSTPLYRLYNSSSGDHFYTTSASERASAIANAGYGSEGVACDVLSQADPGTAPLYRAYNPGNGDHFYTTNAAERDSAVAGGYVSEGVACHVYNAAGTARLPLYRLYKRYGAAVDVNVILVGVDNFTQANRTEVVGALAAARDIYAKVGLLIRTVQWYGVSAADAGALEIIDSSSEARDLTNDWSVPNHAIDLFVVRVMNGADGWSAVNGPCDKNDGKTMTGSVVSLNGPVDNSGNTFAHEMGHYLGLNHIADIGNFIGNNGSSNSYTGIYGWQGATMVKHCFVYDV